MLSKGQEWDWLGDPFWRVQTLVTSLVVGLVALILWELRHRNPVVNFRALGERNFAACCIIIFCAYLALFAGTKSLLGLLQALFGYDALTTGLVMSPAGILRRPGDADRRAPDWSQGRCAMADRRRPSAHERGKLLDVATQPRHQPRRGCLASRRTGPRALSMFCARKRRSLPLYAACVARGGHWFIEPPAERRRQRRGVVVPDLRGTARSVSRAAARRVARSFQPGGGVLPRAGSGALPATDRRSGRSATLGLAALENLREQQSSSLAYFDTFWMAAVLTFVVAFAVLLMKRSVAEKGAHVGSEG